MTRETDAGAAVRLRELESRLAEAAERSGRGGEDITLIAVSKMHDASAVLAAARAGQRDFGENYVQEALAKMERLEDSGEPAAQSIRWHFIGRLQSNKAKFLPGRFAMVHSLDSSKLARSLHKRLSADHAPRLDALIQVNPVGEEQKGGVAEDGLPALAEEVAGLESLRLRGLMFMPPFELEPEERRPLFARVRELRDRLEQRLGRKLPVLSMGMTDDYVQAVLEGATHVRIGTAIFGPRRCAA
jgi:hypothetical protein